MGNTERRAMVSNVDATLRRVEAYLPGNYSAQERADGRIEIIGHDRAGWTLDDYVIPRLASGMIFATEEVQ